MGKEVQNLPRLYHKSNELQFILTCTSIRAEAVWSNKKKKEDRLTRLRQKLLATKFYIKDTLINLTK